ncbi:protein kinase [Nocardia sp. NPDC127526]|uniref:serine/threonine-protein kinase n=1 Tax=Nocardia sp. NPDC127526 TaxID=3345393 RepID=UPI00363DB163
MSVKDLNSTDIGRVRAALPGYDIDGQIGRGGCGVVLAGTHRGLHRRVAIKQIPPQFADDMQVRRRFVDEARVMAALDHPHVVPVYDYIEHEDLCLLVLEYLPGGTVENRFITAGFEAMAAVAVALSCAAGLDAAHRHGVLHRDVKPSNLMFAANGTLKLTDFGIAKIVGGDETLVTRAGEIIGTPSYIAPEQVRGQQLSPSTDVYALATMLYQLLSGTLPFPPGADALAVLFAHAYGEPVQLGEVAPTVPEPIAEVVMHGLASDPVNRYDSAEAFGIALGEPAVSCWGAHWLTPIGIPVIGADTIVAAATGATRSVMTPRPIPRPPHTPRPLPDPYGTTAPSSIAHPADTSDPNLTPPPGAASDPNRNPLPGTASNPNLASPPVAGRAPASGPNQAAPYPAREAERRSGPARPIQPAAHQGTTMRPQPARPDYLRPAAPLGGDRPNGPSGRPGAPGGFRVPPGTPGGYRVSDPYAGARGQQGAGFRAAPGVRVRPLQPVQHNGVRLIDVDRGDLVPIQRVVTLPSPRLPFLAAAVLTVVAGGAAVLGVGAAAEPNTPPAGVVRIAGADPAVSAIDLDLSEPVPIEITGADADSAKLGLNVLGAGIGGATTPLQPGNPATAELPTPVNQYVLAGDLTGELTLSRGGTTTATYEFDIRTTQRATTTVTAIALALLLLFATAYTESNARALRRGSARFAATIGLTISAALLGVVAVGASWILLGHEPTVTAVIACAALGAAAGLAFATGCRRIGKRYRYVRLHRDRDRDRVRT